MISSLSRTRFTATVGTLGRTASGSNGRLLQAGRRTSGRCLAEDPASRPTAREAELLLRAAGNVAGRTDAPTGAVRTDPVPRSWAYGRSATGRRREAGFAPYHRAQA